MIRRLRLSLFPIANQTSQQLEEPCSDALLKTHSILSNSSDLSGPAVLFVVSDGNNPFVKQEESLDKLPTKLRPIAI